MKNQNMSNCKEKLPLSARFKWTKRGLKTVFAVCFLLFVAPGRLLGYPISDELSMGAFAVGVVVAFVLAKLTPNKEEYRCKGCGYVHIPNTGKLLRSKVKLQCPQCGVHGVHTVVVHQEENPWATEK